MHKILFLVHRIPYPPNKGDKIRSYHLLEKLTKEYQVYLGAFIDDDDDWKHVSKLQGICKDVFFIKLNPLISKIKSFLGLIKKEPLTLPYYRNMKFQCWVDGVIKAEDITTVLVFSAAMAQYVSHVRYKALVKVIDFVDIDSDKWRQYAEKQTWPMSWVYKRESHYLENYEKKIASEFKLSYFVSKAESNLFQKILPEHSNKIKYFNNGVNTDYFSPNVKLKSPFAKNTKVLVFTGAMDYWANVDAVVWFASEIFPHILKVMPEAGFYIVGSNPSEEVLNLADNSITVTGTVPDIRPYVAHANLVVAPLRIARGIQNKVLEAMAMAKPVLVTTQAYEGIDDFLRFTGKISDVPAEMARYCVNMLNGDSKNSTAISNREFVIENYNWDKNLSQVCLLLDKL